MGGLLLTTLCFNLLGLRSFKLGRIEMAHVWLLIGSLIYGSSIFLIAQIYHLGEYYSNGFLLWGIGVLPVALLVEGTWLMMLSLIAATFWLFLEAWVGFVPSGYILFVACALWFSTRLRESPALFLSTVAAGLSYLEMLVTRFVSPDVLPLELGSNHVYFTAGAFIVLYEIGCRLEKREPSCWLSDYGLVLRLWCLRFGIITLLVMSFSEPWMEFLTAHPHWPFVAAWLLLVVFLSFLLNIDNGKVQCPPSIAFLTALIASALAAGFGLQHRHPSAFLDIGPDMADVSSILVNLALLFVGIRLITRAVKTSSGAGFSAGIGIILLTALLRYVDLIGDYIGGTVLFFAAALVLLGSANYWKRVSGSNKMEVL